MDAPWIPSSCTLPTAEQPLRQAEFDALFRANLAHVEGRDSTHLRLLLEGPADLPERVRDLLDRETSCCSFFTFTLSVSRLAVDDSRLQVDVEVPAGQADVLESLARRAQALLDARAGV